MNSEIIIDTEGAAMGRIATFAAKQALLGKKVIILNCDGAVITGKKHAILEAYKVKIRRGGYSQKGPYISRTVEKIMKRAIRGMLPWNINRGRVAFKLIRCYSGAPEEYAKSDKIIRFEKAKSPNLSLAELTDLM